MRQKVFISYSHKDAIWLSRLRESLSLIEDKYPIEFWDDTQIAHGARWDDEIEGTLAEAKVAVLLVSANFLASDYIKKRELQPLLKAAKENGLPFLWIAVSDSLFDETEIKNYQCLNNPRKPLDRMGTGERSRVIVEICRSIKEAVLKFIPPPNTFPVSPSKWESGGGALPFDSPFYVERAQDKEFYNRVDYGDGIIRIKGLRQVGKTSLLLRGMARADAQGAKVLYTDVEMLPKGSLKSLDGLVTALATGLTESLKTSITLDSVSSPRWEPIDKFDAFIKAILREIESKSVVWALDEVGYLLPCDYADEFFRRLRTWFNARGKHPRSLGKLTLIISYATEPEYLLKEINESPFNVGQRIILGDFTLDEVEYLNYLYGSPLDNRNDMEEFRQFVAGHPLLVRRGLHAMAKQKSNFGNFNIFKSFKSAGYLGEEPFGDHLRHLLRLLSEDKDILAAVKDMLNNKPLTDALFFHRLRSLGVITGDAPVNARIRCDLYTEYLNLHLNGRPSS